MTCAGPLYERLWRPVLLAALNTDPREAAAGLAAQLLRETLAAGGQACRPLIARAGLSAAFVDPALRHLASNGVAIHFGRRLRALGFDGDAVERLDFGEQSIALGAEDAVVLAVPPWIAADLMPGLAVPTAFRAIVNAHFKAPPPPGTPPVTGLVGGLSEWLFVFPDRLSVTISGADRLLGESREALAALIWQEVAGLTGLRSAGRPSRRPPRTRRSDPRPAPTSAISLSPEIGRRPACRPRLRAPCARATPPLPPCRMLAASRAAGRPRKDL
jgi:hypothetical protein